MKYVALFRGINVGTSRRFDMKDLRLRFSGLGFMHVSTYINSGNVLFESDERPARIGERIMQSFSDDSGDGVRILIKDADAVRRIADAVPLTWKNDSGQKTDVAYLFDEIDYAELVDELPIKKEFLEILYVPGAVIWNVEREQYGASRLNKMISHPAYRHMTVRNVNTARYLAGAMA